MGEASHTYTKIGIYPHAVTRIAEHLPEAKLLYIVRHPLVRMESGWAQLVYSRVTRLRQDFNTSLRTVPSIVESSLYWKQINVYRRHYPDERIHVMFLEDLKHDPHGELARCFAFLGVNPDFRVRGAEIPRNARAGRTIDEPLGDARRLLWHSVFDRLCAALGEEQDPLRDPSARLGRRHPPLGHRAGRRRFTSSFSASTASRRTSGISSRYPPARGFPAGSRTGAADATGELDYTCYVELVQAPRRQAFMGQGVHGVSPKTDQ